MKNGCPASCTRESFHYCGTSGTHCDKHCVCLCHLCAKERNSIRPVRLPENVRARIRLLWLTDTQHAAKQAFCFFLDHSNAFKRDHNLVVDIGIETGMLAQSMMTFGPDFFIASFEISILNT